MLRLSLLTLAAALALFAASPDFSRALKLYSRTDYERSLELLLSLPSKNGEVYGLIGRNYYMLGNYKKATDHLVKATAAEPGSSEFWMWLGRAWGRRAETSSVFTAPGFAGKSREAFETAVRLDPGNAEAMNDLFEYYLQAPGFLGGGLDKASSLAARIARRDKVEGYWAQARLAEKRKEYGQAEQQLRSAAELAPQQIGRVIDLAKFLARRGRIEESEQAFEQAARISPNHPKLLYERAELYIREKRNMATARALLERYLKSDLTPDDPPRSQAERLLKEAAGG
ncbi:MAG: tetratricopeptide repeat protein [Bryobacterales bacterium]|nr:tetratricopeptide repeat protein [Bryobacterales bacterium]